MKLKVSIIFHALGDIDRCVKHSEGDGIGTSGVIPDKRYSPEAKMMCLRTGCDPCRLKIPEYTTIRSHVKTGAKEIVLLGSENA